MAPERSGRVHRSEAAFSNRQIRDELDRLSSRVRRLAPPSARTPERFHEERSEIAGDLQKLAEKVRD